MEGTPYNCSLFLLYPLNYKTLLPVYNTHRQNIVGLIFVPVNFDLFYFRQLL